MAPRIEAPPFPEIEQLPKTAWLFPGQGTQEVGMGKKLHDRYSIAHQIYQEADKICGFPLSTLSFEGPENLLTRTVHAQPAIFVYNHVCFRVLTEQAEDGFKHPAVLTAGHSLGEYNALVAAGALSFEDGLILVRKRSEAMQSACEQEPTGMLATVGLTEKEINYLQEEFGLEIATINTHDQIVFGGTLANLDEARQWLKPRKQRSSRLNVAGAFHTSWMKPAQEIFSRVLDETTIQDAEIPIVANASAKVLQQGRDIRDELVNQITQPILWRETLGQLDQNGVRQIIEIGEKGILSNMNKKVLGGLVVGTVVTLTGVTTAILWQHHHR